MDRFSVLLHCYLKLVICWSAYLGILQILSQHILIFVGCEQGTSPCFETTGGFGHEPFLMSGRTPGHPSVQAPDRKFDIRQI